jgi:hypothetical protein
MPEILRLLRSLRMTRFFLVILSARGARRISGGRVCRADVGTLLPEILRSLRSLRMTL